MYCKLIYSIIKYKSNEVNKCKQSSNISCIHMFTLVTNQGKLIVYKCK